MLCGRFVELCKCVELSSHCVLEPTVTCRCGAGYHKAQKEKKNSREAEELSS